LPSSPLVEIGPNRLNGVPTTACDGSHGLLGQRLSGADLRFVQAVRGSCNAACRANLDELQRAVAACEAQIASGGRSCRAASLHAGLTAHADLQASGLCGAATSGLVAGGGAEFFTVFKHVFNWDYLPIEAPQTYDLSLPEVAGPLVLGFDAAGRIVFAKEGALAAGELAALAAKPRLEPARGPDFAMYRRTEAGADETFGFATWRQKARYTVLSAWGAYPLPCGSCIEELQRWSGEGALLDYCAARPTQCQMAALETHLPEADSGKTLAGFYDGILHGDGADFDGFAALGIRVPLLLDPRPEGDDPQGYLRRIFDGYLVASFPDWGKEYRTVIYDREGKIVAAFRSMPGAAEDPVLKTLRRLLGD
jgi:hypothetical protein